MVNVLLIGFKNADKLIDHRFFPEYMLGYYEKARKNYISIMETYKNDNVLKFFFDSTTNKYIKINPKNLKVIDNDKELDLLGVKKVLNNSSSPRVKYYNKYNYI